MNADDRSRRALSLFDELVDLDADLRAARLSRLREEDTALYAEIVALLEADSREGLLEKTVLSLLAAPEPSGEIPSRIGPWRITGVAGRGGMGAVYFGERDDGQFQQRAAIKLIRVGMDTPELRARFLRERQILAALEHPHIATLLDGGVTDTGAPYFAMQRVEGAPIDDWCDAKHATVRERVALFLQVCAAVQHAHQNLIVHRDLKPSNILVDAEGQAKLLDFGIARLLEAGPEMTYERPHTPEYAAPEQIAGGAITTATDVYGLGVVLYQLICGRPPREADEPLPRAVAQAPAETVRARGVASTKQLLREVRGDLSAIAHKCLQKEPARRYASVGALAQDLRAWLERRPVAARRQTRGYVVTRFIARNRFAVAAAAAVLVAIAGGVTGVLWQAEKARAAAAEAQAQLDYLRGLLEVLAPSTAEARELDRSRLIAEAARRARAELTGRPASLAGVELALAQVAHAVGDYRQAEQLADSAHALRISVYGASSLEVAETAVVAAQTKIRISPPRFEEAARLLDGAIAILRHRAPGSAELAGALQTRSTVEGEQNRLAEQEVFIREAAAICEGPACREAPCERVWRELGAIASQKRQPHEAIAHYTRAWEARKKRLGAQHASTLDLASMLAWAKAEAGDLDGGLALAEDVYRAYQDIYTQPNEKTLRGQLRLFRLARRAGQRERAMALIDDYLQHARRVFGEQHPDTVLGYSDRGSLLYNLGRFEEAAAEFARASSAYAAMDNGINAALTRSFQGEALREAGRPAEALPLQIEAVATLRRLYPDGEHVMLGRALSSLGVTESALRDHARALEHHAEAMAMQRRLHAPGLSHAANAQAFYGKALFDLGRRREGEAELRAAVEALAPLRDDVPNQYWEPVALLTLVACANGAPDCESLKALSRQAEGVALAATTQRRLREALGEE
ncbi:MAG: serine/threonine protein kinase [Myxococcaceae bacterium]|nr:serine/threonine protein kinase [Myxococcaceae bacterium]